MENEDLLDLYEDKLGTYLGKLSGRELSEIDGKSVSQQLHTISDFERMGDHAVNVLKIAEEMHSKKIRFSEETINEVSVLSAALTEIINTTIESYSKNSISVAKRVEPLEEAIDSLIVDVKSRHMQRLKDGEYSIELGFVLSDLLTNLERISAAEDVRAAEDEPEPEVETSRRMVRITPTTGCTKYAKTISGIGI